jgi:hypothetical protein
MTRLVFLTQEYGENVMSDKAGRSRQQHRILSKQTKKKHAIENAETRADLGVRGERGDGRGARVGKKSKRELLVVLHLEEGGVVVKTALLQEQLRSKQNRRRFQRRRRDRHVPTTDCKIRALQCKHVKTFQSTNDSTLFSYGARGVWTRA